METEKEYTDLELQTWLSKQLPDIIGNSPNGFFWKSKSGFASYYIHDSSWDYVVRLVEKKLIYWPDYLFYLRQLLGFPDSQSEWDDYWWQDVVGASWQQRTVALSQAIKIPIK